MNIPMHLFKDIKVITNSSNYGNSKWLVLSINIYPLEFRHTVRLTSDSGNIDGDILQLGRLLENRFLLGGEGNLKKLQDDIVSDFTINDYLLISDGLRKLGFVYNKKTKKLQKIKQI